MGKRSGKKRLPCFSSWKARPAKRTAELQPVTSPPPVPGACVGVAANKNHGSWAADGPSAGAPHAGARGAKKKTAPLLWMRFDRSGRSEILECDRSAIIRRAAIPARDLRILGPVFSHSSNILAREKAMVVNLEFIRAIVTAEEVLVLDPLCQEVLPFVDQLRKQLTLRTPSRIHELGHTDILSSDMFSTGGQWLHVNESAEGERELPFEFQVLEIALEVVCSYLDSSVGDLERDAYPVLDELTMNVSTKNLERVRSLKSNITHLLARVEKVRDEIEHLLDDNEDMAHLYLTRKQIQYQHFEVLMASGDSNGTVVTTPNLARLSSTIHGSASIVTIYSDDSDVEDLEMLLEAYFMQLDGTYNKILSVREYIDDTEDYVNIRLDNHRNELIQLQLILYIAMFAISINMLLVASFSMNIPCELYEMQNLFRPFVGGMSSGCLLLFLLILGYARWKKLISS